MDIMRHLHTGSIFLRALAKREVTHGSAWTKRFRSGLIRWEPQLPFLRSDPREAFISSVCSPHLADRALTPRPWPSLHLSAKKFIRACELTSKVALVKICKNQVALIPQRWGPWGTDDFLQFIRTGLNSYGRPVR